MNFSQVLDLPKPERSKYLAAMPLTRCYVFGCMDYCHIKHIRRVIVANGGTWRELYCVPGLAVTATFRTHKGMMAATRSLVHWQNEAMRKNNEPNWWYNDDFGITGPSVPALKFEIVNAIYHDRPVARKFPIHPIRG